jgi:hypothetical protein
MKTWKLRTFGLFAVAVIAVTVFSITACKEPEAESGGGGNNPPVTFSGVTADGSTTQTTTQLTLTFSQAVTGLTANDITLSGVSSVRKGILSSSGASYTLPISGFTAGGTLTVAVAKLGYTINGSPMTVNIYHYTAPIAVTFSTLTADGSATQTTTQLTLNFSQAVTGLTAEDISLSGVSSVQKGILSDSGPSYTLPISGFIADGTLTVAVTKSGYNISGSPKTVTVYYATTTTFNDVTADGSTTQTTTQLTLTFGQTIASLSEDDITLSGVSGVQKGILSGSGPTYTLPISGFTADGTLFVTVEKSGFAISGSPKTVTIYYVIAATFSDVTANGSATQTTTQLTLTFSQGIAGLTADDISLSGVSGVQKGTLSGWGTTYTLPISGFSTGGTVTVSVSKSRHVISPASLTVTIYATGTATLSITFVQITDAAPSIIGPTLYRVSNGGPTNATLTVDNPDQYDSISWRVQDTAVTGAGSSFTLSAANTAYNLIGEHFVTVLVMKDGVPYNKTVSFKIEY